MGGVAWLMTPWHREISPHWQYFLYAFTHTQKKKCLLCSFWPRRSFKGSGWFSVITMNFRGVFARVMKTTQDAVLSVPLLDNKCPELQKCSTRCFRKRRQSNGAPLKCKDVLYCGVLPLISFPLTTGHALLPPCHGCIKYDGAYFFMCAQAAARRRNQHPPANKVCVKFASVVGMLLCSSPPKQTDRQYIRLTFLFLQFCGTLWKPRYPEHFFHNV